MLSVWGSKSRPQRVRPDRRGGARDRLDAPRAFVDRLAANGLLDPAGHERALAALDLPGRRPLPVLLAELGLVHEAALVEALAEATGLAVLQDEDLPAAPVLPETIGADYCARARVLPLAEEADGLVVALVDAFDPEIPAALEHLTDRKVTGRLVGPSQFERAHRALYGDAGGDEDGGADDDLTRLADVAS